ncbi:MAG: 2-dehydro-3-deoxygalactonokinase [bacterium]
MRGNNEPPPALIALDWGTTSVRAWLLAANASVLEARAEPWGIMHLPPGGFVAAYDALTADWRAQWPDVASLASGMVGSAQGWVQAPYCDCPATAHALGQHLVRVPDVDLHVVPGVTTSGAEPDMMRGEETQIVGAMERYPELAVRSLIVLPGTHSKWASIENGAIQSFSTYITGELFSVLSTHSILGRPARDATHESGDLHQINADRAFEHGVLAVRDQSRALSSLLFSTRARVLAGHMQPSESLDYLSGLLIGDEIRSALELDARPLALIGDPALVNRYRRALLLFGASQPCVVDGAAQAGISQIARLAGLSKRRSA